jgi:hypothetical protein
MTIDNEHNGEAMGDHDDAEFALFLQQEGELSRQLHALPQPGSPPELDAAILARIGAALSEERTPVAANDAAAAVPPNPAASPIRSPLRSRWAPWWRVSVGIAAGVLVATVFRMTWTPGQDTRQPQVALLAKTEPPQKTDQAKKTNDTDDASEAVTDAAPQPQRYAAPSPALQASPKAKRSAERAEEPSFARAPAAVAPPPAAAAPPALTAPAAPTGPVVAMASQAAPERSRQLRAVAPPKPDSSAYAAAAPQNDAPVQRVEVTGQSVRRADTETASPVQVITSQEVAQSSYGRIEQKQKTQQADPVGEASGTELAWNRDPARIGLQESPSARAPAAAPNADLAAADAPKPAVQAPMLASAARAEFAPSPAPIVAAPPPAVRMVTPLTASPSASAAKPNQPAAAQMRKLQLGDEEKMRRKPSTWLTLIEQKLKAQNDAAAREEWQKFRQIYPNYPVKRALSERMQSLQEKQ